MERKFCTHCNVEKNIEAFYNKYTECKICNCIRSVKRFMKIKIKYQIRKNYIMKKTEKNYYKNKTLDM